MNSRFTVRTGEGFVAIDYDGKEVLYWDQAEWVEDPTVTIAIVNAVNEALAHPHKLVTWLTATGRL